MNIVEAVAGEEDEILDVAEASWLRDYPEILTRESAVEGVHEWYSKETIKSSIAKETAQILVAKRAGVVVGFVHVAEGETDGAGDILRTYVSPDHRGEGIGSALLETGVEWLLDHGVEHIRARVLAANEPGRQFYVDHGFAPTDDTETTLIAGEEYEEYTYVQDH